MIIRRLFLVVFAAATAGEFRAAADGAPLVIQLARGHLPALVDLADHRIVTELQVVEELLAELGRSVDLLDPAQRDARAVHSHQKHRQAFVLGHIPVRPGQQQAVVGGEGSGAPRLGAVDHPLVAAPLGAGDHTRQVRAAAGLREQLDEHLVAAQRRRNVLPLLVFAAGVEDRRTTDGERRDIQNQRHLVAGAFGVESLLILDVQTEPAVLGGKANPGEPAVVKPSL